jgi:MFS family permease
MGVLCAVFGGVAWWTVPRSSETRGGGNVREKLRRFDLLGALLATAGVAMVTAGLTLVGLVRDGWRTPYILVLLIVGVLALVCFVFWEADIEHPLMPLKIWKDRNFSLLVAILSLCFCGFSGNLLWLCLIWQRIEHNTPLLVDANGRKTSPCSSQWDLHRNHRRDDDASCWEQDIPDARCFRVCDLQHVAKCRLGAYHLLGVEFPGSDLDDSWSRLSVHCDECVCVEPPSHRAAVIREWYLDYHVSLFE